MKKIFTLSIHTILIIMFLGLMLPITADAAGEKTVLDISYGPITIFSDYINGYNSSGAYITTANPNGYIITGASIYNGSQNIQISIASGTHNITLKDLSLYNNYQTQSSGMYVAAGATANITLEGANYLYGYGTGILAPEGATVTITGGATDSLTVSARVGAGIGGRKGEFSTYAFRDCGNVTINGGTVVATGGQLSAGIGGGEYGLADTISIAGGTVTAGTVGGGVGIGGGYGNTSLVDKIQITGGSINATLGKRPVNASTQSVYKTTMTLPTAEVAAVESLTVKQGTTTIPYGITGMNTDANEKLYIYLPASESKTTADITVGGITYHYNGIISANDSNTLKMDQDPLSLSISSSYTYGDTISPTASGGTLSGTVAFLYSGTDTTGRIITNSSIKPANAGSYTVTAVLSGNAWYYDATASAGFTINAKSIAGFSVDNIANQSYTGAAVIPAVTVKDAAKNITLAPGTDYTVSSPNVNVGGATATITAKGNYTGALTKAFTIVPKNITVSLTASPSATTKVGNDVALTAEITGAVNLPAGTVTFKYGGTVIHANAAISETDGVYSAAATWSGVSYGSYNLTAIYNAAVNDNYSCTSNGSITGYSVTKYLQTSFAVADGTGYDIADGKISKTYGDAVFTLETTGQQSTGAVTYSSSDASVASVDAAGTVTLLKSGTVTLTAVSPSDATYSAASAAVTLEVAKANQSAFTIADGAAYDIADGKINKTYGDAAFTLETSGRMSTGAVTYSSSDTSVAAVNASGAVTPLKSGTVTLTVQSAADERYNTAAASVTLEISRASLSSFELISSAGYTIVDGAISKTYGDASFVLAVSTCVGPVNYASSDTSVASVSSSGTVTILKSGMVTLSADSLQTDCYNEASATVTLNINKAAQSGFNIIAGSDYDLAEGDISKTYGDAAFTLETTGKLSSNGTTYTSSDPEVASVSSSGVVTLHKSGAVTLSAVSTADDRYHEATASVTLHVSRADQNDFAIADGTDYDMSDGTISKTYGDAPFVLEVEGQLSTNAALYSVTGGSDVVSVDSSSGEVTLLRSGTATVTVISPADERYNPASATVTIQVARAEQSGFAFAEDSVTTTYGDAPFAVPISGGESTGAITYEVTGGYDVVSVDRTSGYITLLKSGTAVITATKAADTKYNATDASVEIAVGKAIPPTVIFPSASSITYGQTLSDSALSGGSGDGSFDWEDTDTVPTVSNSGYTVVFTPRDTDNFNYTGITLSQTVSITVYKATASVTFPTAGAITYGQPLSASALTDGSGDGSFAWETPDAIPAVINSGYDVVFTPDDTDNYLTIKQIVSLTVDKAVQAPLAVGGIPDTLTYGDGSFRLTVEGGSGTGMLSFQVVSGDAVSVNSSGIVTIRRPGKAVLTVTKMEDDNYDAATATVEINVRKAAVGEETPSALPTPSATPTSTTTPSPTAANASLSPTDSLASVTLNPLSIQADESTGMIAATISIDDLPEGTAAIQLPSGEIIQIDTTQATLQLQISRADLDENGRLEIIALNKESIPMGSCMIDLADETSLQDTNKNGPGLYSVLLWTAAGILVIGMASAGMVLWLKKKK